MLLWPPCPAGPSPWESRWTLNGINITTLEELAMADMLVEERMHTIVEKAKEESRKEGIQEGIQEGERRGELKSVTAFVQKHWGTTTAEEFRTQLADPAREVPSMDTLMDRLASGKSPLAEESGPADTSRKPDLGVC